jgi:heme exporter protein C
MASVARPRIWAAARGGSQILLATSALLFAVDLFLIFEYAPTPSEAVGVQVGRMLFIHPPIAMVGLISVVVSASASVVFLVRRGRGWDRIAWASAEVGAVALTVAVGTGAIWAKPVWLTWWVWDANGGYLIVRAYAPTPERGARWAAVVAILGAAAVPFVYMAADWWTGQHVERITGPGASGSMEGRMFVTFVFSFVTFLFLFAALVASRASQLGNEERIRELRMELT